MTDQLPDKRLEERFARLRQQLGERPEDYLTEACGNAAEVKAAYRFLG